MAIKVLFGLNSKGIYSLKTPLSSIIKSKALNYMNLKVNFSLILFFEWPPNNSANSVFLILSFLFTLYFKLKLYSSSYLFFNFS